MKQLEAFVRLIMYFNEIFHIVINFFTNFQAYDQFFTLWWKFQDLNNKNNLIANFPNFIEQETKNRYSLKNTRIKAFKNNFMALIHQI